MVSARLFANQLCVLLLAELYVAGVDSVNSDFVLKSSLQPYDFFMYYLGYASFYSRRADDVLSDG